MQKNKFIHEDIKAVCSSATKKLVALGLVAAVGGTCTVGCDNRHLASAQLPEDLERRREAVLGRAYEHDLALGLSEDMAQANRERDSESLTTPTAIANFEMRIDREIEARLDSERRRERVIAEIERERERERERARARAIERERERAIERERERAIERERAATTNPQSARRNNLGTPQMIQARGNQHIEAGPHTHIHSFSDNELTHEGEGLATITGLGAVDIDTGDIKVSECNEDLSRNVTVNQSNLLTVAPGITTRIQNGTEFSMGGTLEETIDNLIPDIQPSANQESNTQQRNLNFNNPRLRRFLTWAMKQFGLSGQDLIDFVQRYFIQGG